MRRIDVTVKNGANALGIVGLVLGVLGLIVCWIPMVGFAALPLAALGGLVSIIGLLTSLTFRRTGIGFPVGGLIACALALGVGVLNVFAVSEAARSMSTALSSARAKESATNQEVVSSGAPNLAEPNPGPVAISTPETLATPTPVPAATPVEETWAPAASPVRQGPVEVQITAAIRDKVTYIPKFSTSWKKTWSPYLAVRLRILNITDTRKLSFETWRLGEMPFDETGFATLYDNFDNLYKHITLGGVPFGGRESESIYPGKAISEVLVFELPIEKAETLKLALPAKNFGGEGMLRFAIPVSMIEERNSEGPDMTIGAEKQDSK